VTHPTPALVDIEELENVIKQALPMTMRNESPCEARVALRALLAELRQAKQELVNWKAMMRRFVPSNREPTRCRNCERLFIDHYGGPFGEPDTAYCSKYAVPVKPPTPPEATNG
jgi:hypothetical protein